jgi:hypothetical protein
MACQAHKMDTFALTNDPFDSARGYLARKRFLGAKRRFPWMAHEDTLLEENLMCQTYNLEDMYIYGYFHDT